MLSSRNLLSPADGAPVVAPTKDIVFGQAYTLTSIDPEAHRGDDTVYPDAESSDHRLLSRAPRLQGRISVRLRPSCRWSHHVELRTSAGQLLFNALLHPNFVSIPSLAYPIPTRARSKSSSHCATKPAGGGNRPRLGGSAKKPAVALRRPRAPASRCPTSWCHPLVTSSSRRQRRSASACESAPA